MSAPARRTWEYATIPLLIHNTKAILDSWGVDGWELVEPLHVGPLTRTYRARPVGGPADCPAAYVLKRLRRRWWDVPQAVAMMRREAQLGRTVSHRHLISILATGAGSPPHYVVTPWLEGATLEASLNQRPILDVPVALWTARQVAEALDALWAAGDRKSVV